MMALALDCLLHHPPVRVLLATCGASSPVAVSLLSEPVRPLRLAGQPSPPPSDGVRGWAGSAVAGVSLAGEHGGSPFGASSAFSANGACRLAG